MSIAGLGSKIAGGLMALNNFISKEEELEEDEECADYSRWHGEMKNKATSVSKKMKKVLKPKSEKVEEVCSEVVGMNLTPEQTRAIVKISEDPMYKKVMGETALDNVKVLEDTLGIKISNVCPGVDKETGEVTLYKTKSELDSEFSDYYGKVKTLHDNGVLTDAQMNGMKDDLSYIHDFYVSQWEGEQISLRAISNDEYAQFEQAAVETGTTLDEQLEIENFLLVGEHVQAQRDARHELARQTAQENGTLETKTDAPTLASENTQEGSTPNASNEIKQPITTTISNVLTTQMQDIEPTQ